MPLLNKKEKDLLQILIERKQELTSEEVQDLQETLDFEEGFGRPRYQEVVDEDGFITYEYID